MGNWGLIALGVAIGTVIGVPAALQVRMTAIPQMVALFNGVGGGAVALIAWVEFRNSGGYVDDATYIAIFSLFGAIVGSVSFWGSNIAFGKLQEIIPGRPISLGRAQQFATGTLTSALASSIEKSLGLDTFEINTAPENGGMASLTIGQQVGQNLYVKVEQGIGGQSETNFILEYELARWLRLRTNVLQGSSTQQQLFQRAQGSGVDLLFFFSY